MEQPASGDGRKVTAAVSDPRVENGRDGPYAVAYANGEESSIMIPHSVFEGGILPNRHDGVELEARWRVEKSWYATWARVITLTRKGMM